MAGSSRNPTVSGPGASRTTARSGPTPSHGDDVCRAKQSLGVVSCAFVAAIGLRLWILLIMLP
jgi:hypothetical protein